MTLGKVEAYLEKGGAKEWWEGWMKGAKDESVEQFCQPGNTLFLFYCPVLHIFTMTAVN